MKIEHFALNVENPHDMADWYVDNFGLKVVKKEEEPPYTIFLLDTSDCVMIEIYRNPIEKVPDYWAMDPLVMHLAWISKNLTKDKKRLLKSGASEVNDEVLEDGSRLVMLRDPWGLSIQLCKRSNPMLPEK
jgi:catechol 2,3-dioxygenase-like lactoylglutathione lyase family enzyme